MGCCGSRQVDTKKRTRAISQNIRQFYRFGALIGQGAFGTVRLGFRESAHGEQCYAIKTINKAKIQDKLYLLQQEFQVLSQMDHPNIIRFFEMYEDQMFIYFVMEQCTGGNLLQKVLDSGPFGEEKTRLIMRKLFQAVSYMHKQGVMHRDLKPDNILFSNLKANSDIKIIDFGLSKKLKNKTQLQRSQSRVGSPLYVAPEVIGGIYDFKCDVWSLGCIMFVLLCGEPPFYSDSMNELIQKIQTEDVAFSQPEWQTISVDAKRLIKSLLTKEPLLRVTSQEALYTDWMKKDKKLTLIMTSNRGIVVQRSQETPVNTANIKALRDYSNSKMLKRETLRILINQLNEKQIQRLTEKFKEIDINNDGFITYSELQIAMTKLGLKNTQQEIEQLVTKITTNPHSPMKIRYTEFLAATIDQKLYLDKEKLWHLFRYFDIENKNYITIEDIKVVLEREGREDIDCTAILNEIKNEKIDFDEFRKIMCDDIVLEKQEVFEHFEQQYASPQRKV